MGNANRPETKVGPRDRTGAGGKRRKVRRLINLIQMRHVIANLPRTVLRTGEPIQYLNDQIGIRCESTGHLYEVTSGGDDDASGRSPGTSLNIVNGVCYFDFEPSTCVPWQGVFNMRPQNLQAMASLQKGPSISFHKARLGCVTPASRSLEVLREYLQPMINQEIRKVN